LVAGAVDALVYLVPGEQSQPGLAVVVPARGDCIVRRLPDLRADEGSPLHGFAESSGVLRDLASTGPSASSRSLSAVCEWAWTAAMAEVLAAVGGKAERLVLLPFGLLSVIPWHAACSWRDGRRRYLVEDAAVSYSPSARLFCDGIPFAPAPIRSALVVGNPGDDLAFAGIEARAIHRTFYPDGAYFGPGGARAGTPGEVLDWIDSSPAGPTVLHFACHAAIDAERPTEAHLILSAGATLSTDTLLHRSRTAALDLEQVFLAACTTSGTRSVHDEVLSLASTFLAAGARAVVGSLWAAPDTETSLLMFMVHRYLRVDGCAPAEALRRAQRWMLAADREVPADLPAELRAQCRPGTEFDLTAWAGFIHLGR
jgi:CHAT domain-containing protein